MPGGRFSRHRPSIGRQVTVGIAATAGFAAAVTAITAGFVWFRNIQKPDPISEDEFDFLLGDDGRLTQFEELLRMVAKNGVCANLRERVWPYLLGVFKPSMSATDIDRAQKSLRSRFASLMDEAREMHRLGTESDSDIPIEAAQFMEAHRIILADAIRQDMRAFPSAHVPESPPSSPSGATGAVASGLLWALEAASSSRRDPLDLSGIWLSAEAVDTISCADHLAPAGKRVTGRLVAVLLAYALEDPTVGYCQGMADLCLPFVLYCEDDALAFELFKKLMERHRDSFRIDEYGYMKTLLAVSEDPEKNFQPEIGRIEAYRPPGGPGIRLDGSLGTGNSISRYYDSLLTKLIVRSSSYQGAIQKTKRALEEFAVRGVKTNIPFLLNVFTHPDFVSGAVTTGFIADNPELFDFQRDGPGEASGSKVLNYLAEMAVNGPSNPGQKGKKPVAAEPSPLLVPAHLADKPLKGWRDVLVAEGPDGFAKKVRAHKGVLLTDTTWRDAHQSLLATRMRTADMIKAAPATAHILANAGSLEMWGGATFDVSLRFLKECPWHRLETLRELVPNVPFQMLLRGANAVGYTTYADNVVQEFVREAKVAGMDIFRVFDSLNYVDNLKFGMDAVYNAGGVVEGTICYTGDLTNPNQKKYTLDYYMGLADELVSHGLHTLAIKDMAGLLKPRAASILISALREKYPDLPIHVHTHDTAGTGVATQLAAAAAGADIIDCAIDSMSGTTSQPSMGAIVNALSGTDLDTGISPSDILPLVDYWEKTRALYSQFEATDSLKSSSSDVYLHEMPGGQYTNLKFQAESLGLGDQWDKVKLSYAAANRVLGDIVKVTPSSKVVGDLAQFMVQNNLDEKSVVEQAESLSFPGSVVEFMQGLIGQPPHGFPEPFRTRVLKGKEIVEGRPGASMPPVNLAELEGRLLEKYGKGSIDKRDVLSAALYPKVFDEYQAHVDKYSSATSDLPTTAFWNPLEEDEEVVMEYQGGQTAHIKYKAKGELQPTGKREVFFETNGVPRVVEVVDRKALETETGKGSRVTREKASSSDQGSIGAPMAGEVVDVQTKPGETVKAGQPLIVLSAMKMETTVAAPISGTIRHVAVERGDTLDAGDLLVSIEAAKV